MRINDTAMIEKGTVEYAKASLMSNAFRHDVEYCWVVEDIDKLHEMADRIDQYIERIEECCGGMASAIATTLIEKRERLSDIQMFHVSAKQAWLLAIAAVEVQLEY